MNDKLIKKMVESILAAMNEQKVIEYKEKVEDIIQAAMSIVREDYNREHALDAEVNRMMDDLERQNPGAFQRFKMFPMLKKRLAKEKGIIL